VTDHKEGYILRKLQRGLSAIETWCERWNVKINEDKTQAIYFSHRLRTLEAHLTVNGQNISFVIHVKYLGVIFSETLHIEMIEAKAFIYYNLLPIESESLSANIKLTLHKALTTSVMETGNWQQTSTS
jgi:hypothetical protein